MSCADDRTYARQLFDACHSDDGFAVHSAHVTVADGEDRVVIRLSDGSAIRFRLMDVTFVEDC